MQHIKLNFDGVCFYCPITGQQLLSEIDYYSSPATLFYFIDIDGGKLVDAKSEIEDTYDKLLGEISQGKYNDYEFEYNNSDEAKAFDILIHQKLKNYSNYVLFELVSKGVACGLLSSTIYIGVDMGYMPILEPSEQFKTDFENCFNEFKNYENILHEATLVAPSEEGYTLFIEDNVGCGGFYFINNVEEWETLIPALVTLDYINQDSNSIPLEVFESMKKVYFDYFNSWVYDALPHDFKNDLNVLLTDYKVLFFGKVSELFEPSSEFSRDLLEEYDANPNQDIEGFLSYLSNYSKY